MFVTDICLIEQRTVIREEKLKRKFLIKNNVFFSGETKLNSLSISEEKVDSNRLFGGNGLENDRDRVKSEVFSTTSTEKNIVLTRSSSSSPVGSTSTPTTTFFYNESSFETSTEEAVKDGNFTCFVVISMVISFFPL